MIGVLGTLAKVGLGLTVLALLYLRSRGASRRQEVFDYLLAQSEPVPLHQVMKAFESAAWVPSALGMLCNEGRARVTFPQDFDPQKDRETQVCYVPVKGTGETETEAEAF